MSVIKTPWNAKLYGIFCRRTVPTENCDHHISLQIYEASGKVAGDTVQQIRL